MVHRFDIMPGAEINKQIDQLLGKSPDIDSADVSEANRLAPAPRAPNSPESGVPP